MVTADQTLYMDEVKKISKYRTEKDRNGIGRL